jgi:biopolymer transport protein ExbD
MTKRIVLSLLMLVLFAGLVHAHGAPILGTVTAVSKDSITVQDKNNKSIVIMLDKDTKYLIADKPAMQTDLKVGVRVVIDAEMDAKTKKYSAEEIKIAPAKN